jgi:hypothetical protein
MPRQEAVGILLAEAPLAPTTEGAHFSSSEAAPPSCQAPNKLADDKVVVAVRVRPMTKSVRGASALPGLPHKPGLPTDRDLRVFVCVSRSSSTAPGHASR